MKQYQHVLTYILQQLQVKLIVDSRTNGVRASFKTCHLFSKRLITTIQIKYDQNLNSDVTLKKLLCRIALTCRHLMVIVCIPSHVTTV